MFKKWFKHNNYLSDLKRKERNRRYYLRHHKEILDKRKDRYSETRK
jgi:hypothetical protein